MKIQVLSHAGLAVSHGGTTLVCDPWLIGSTYWRSWWNYPPVAHDLIAATVPDFIYLTHIHWDHFQGASLRLFDPHVRILVPKGPETRMARDLAYLGFTNVVEVRHGATVKLAEHFEVTSYQFGIFLDSVLVIECAGTRILNANDAKIMGLPLRQVLDRHGPFDFVLRSHSSANSRLCFQLTDDPTRPTDNQERYVLDFHAFARSVGARFAIPFASNHCHLHPETYRFNDTVVTPTMVKDRASPDDPDVEVLVSGDSWTPEQGFDLADTDYFTNRAQRISEYARSVSEKVTKAVEEESTTALDRDLFHTYFDRFFSAVPWAMRMPFRSHPVLWVLRAGSDEFLVETDLYRKSLKFLDVSGDHPVQIHTTLSIMQHCMRVDLFSHLPISKRVTYRVPSSQQRLIQRLNLLFNLVEYDMLPMRKMLSWRFVGAWVSRWREVVLYATIAGRRVTGQSFSFEQYLPRRAPRKGPLGSASARSRWHGAPRRAA